MWQVALAIGMGIASYGSSKRAAADAKRQAGRQAAEIRKQRFDVQELTAQQHLQRSEQFEETGSSNVALAAFMGRSDRSIQALRKEEARRYGLDVSRLREQERREIENIERQAEETRRQGRITAKQYKTQANQTLFNTALTTASLYKAPTTPPGGTSLGGGTGVNMQSSKVGMSPKVLR
jgi:hypothetical protein